jgi:hypothetical protein
VGFINVIRNGSQLAPADYTATNGTTVILNNACTAGDIVVIEVYTLTSISNALPLTGGTVTGASTFNVGVNLAANSGNVGVGTSSPTQKLHVVGIARATGGLQLAIDTDVNFNSGSDNNNRISCNSGAGTMDYRGFIGHRFFTTNGSDTECARINSSGNLTVGATSVPEAARVGISSTSASAVPLVVQQTAAGSTTQNSVVFYRNSTTTGTIQVTGTTTAYNTSSDYRLKENVQPMTGALGKVAALKPCTYTWKLDGSPGEGFIAHELAEVVPQAVGGEKDAVNEDNSIKPQGIDTSFLVATLTAAIQEQQAMIEELKAKVAVLEAK